MDDTHLHLKLRLILNPSGPDGMRTGSVVGEVSEFKCADLPLEPDAAYEVGATLTVDDMGMGMPTLMGIEFDPAHILPTEDDPIFHPFAADDKG